MNRIVLDKKAVELTQHCVPALLHLCEVAQKALDTVTADEHPAGSPERADLDALPGGPDHPDTLRYLNLVTFPAISRSNFIMDNTLAAATLIDLTVDESRRTAMGPAVLGRTVLDTSLKVAHYLAGVFEDRMLKGYASLLAEYQAALSARGDAPGSPADLEDEYRELREQATALGYTLKESRRWRLSSGLPIVEEVLDTRGETAKTDPTTTGQARDAGELWLYQWRLGSGITHGRFWAIHGEYMRLEKGATRGDIYLSATTSIMQAVSTYTEAIATFTGFREPAAEADRVIKDFGRLLEEGGWLSEDESRA